MARKERRRNGGLKTGDLQDAIFNSAYFSSIATDEHGVIQIFNVGAERMLGYAATDVVDQITPADISDPDELVARAEELSAEFGTPITPGFEALVFKASRGIEDIYELTYIRKDGSRFSAVVSVTGLRDSADDRIIGYLLIGTDNTARHEVEAKQAVLDQTIRDQQFYTRSLIESNIDALMTTDPRGIISDVNNQMVALTGRTRDELVGAPCRNFFTDPARADAAIKQVLSEKRVTDYELTVRSHSGRETVVSYNAATFYDRERNLQGVFASARDVTERKSFERTLLETNLELEHASRMKSEFLATMSHELRTPLNAIIGFSEALGDGLMGELSESQHEYIGDIFSSGQHLLSLINDILDLSKVEAGKMTVEIEAVDLQSLLSNSLSIVREKASAKRISLELSVDEGLGVPQLDLRKTKQIVYNLLSNAVKFSTDRGRVTLSARRVLRPQVGVFETSWPSRSCNAPSEAEDEFLELAVTDCGIGLAPENMEKLFEPFTQIDSSLARRFEGTGLGLAMVKQLAELQGGTVGVASALGEGACFAAWLPLRLSSGTPSTPEAAGAEPSDRAVGKRHEETGDRLALVVEDDERAAELLRVLLDAEGFKVVHAQSGEEALALAPQRQISLITLDIQLPGMDGWEFLQRLRQRDDLRDVPVVIISGLVTGDMALAGGAAAVLQKPLSRSDLNTSLTKLGLDAARERPHTVLIVDDDPAAGDMIAAFLPEPAYKVRRAYGGAEAISSAKGSAPDLMLLDLMMPDVDGFSVVEALQRDPATSAIPILVLTAKQVVAEERAALGGKNSSVVDIIDKAGFDRVAFLSGVRRALRHG